VFSMYHINALMFLLSFYTSLCIWYTSYLWQICLYLLPFICRKVCKGKVSVQAYKAHQSVLISSSLTFSQSKLQDTGPVRCVLRLFTSLLSSSAIVSVYCIPFWFVLSPFSCVSLSSWVISFTVLGASVTNLNEPPRALTTSTIMWVRS